MATVHDRKIFHYKIKYQKLFSARFYKIIEKDQRGDETELSINLNFIHNLTESDIKTIDVKSHLGHQSQSRRLKNQWIFDKINSMKIIFHKFGELDGSSYVEIPLRSNTLKKLKIMRNIVSYGQS